MSRDPALVRPTKNLWSLRNSTKITFYCATVFLLQLLLDLVIFSKALHQSFNLPFYVGNRSYWDVKQLQQEIWVVPHYRIFRILVYSEDLESKVGKPSSVLIAFEKKGRIPAQHHHLQPKTILHTRTEECAHVILLMRLELVGAVPTFTVRSCPDVSYMVKKCACYSQACSGVQ